MDYAINVEVPDENIIDRMSGRRACVACGGTYHIKYNPTKKKEFVTHVAASSFFVMTISRKP